MTRTIILQAPMFTAIYEGALAFLSLRFDNYKVGEKLNLRCEFPTGDSYNMPVEITYMTHAQSPCALSPQALHSDYCILSIRKIENENPNVVSP